MKSVKSLFMIILGNTLYALAVVLFISPNGMVMGGTTGMALFFQNAAGFPVPVFVGIFNVAMFILGLAVIGRRFALTTVFSSIYYPIALAVLERVFANSEKTGDQMLAAVCGGLLIGVGIGMVIRAGASTGGMDIPPLMINRKWGIPVAYSMYGFDVLILLLQSIRTDWDSILYGIVLVLFYTVVLNKVLVIGTNRVQVKIISKEYEEINRSVQTLLDRGTTLLAMEGGHLREASYAVMTVLESRELPKLNDIIKQIDPNAFLVINQVTEVRGRGFTLEKRYMNQKDQWSQK